MNVIYDDHLDEMLARGGTFDLTGTNAKTNMQFFAFEASDGAVIDTIKGVALKTAVTTLAGITAAEVDLATYFKTALSDPCLANTIYRVDGFIVTNVKLTSGTLHLYKIKDQISS